MVILALIKIQAWCFDVFKVRHCDYLEVVIGYLESLTLILDFEGKFSVYGLKVLIYGLYTLQMLMHVGLVFQGGTYECVKWKKVLV